MGMEGWVEAEGLLPSREEAKDVFNGEPGRIRARRRAERRGTRRRGGERGDGRFISRGEMWRFGVKMDESEVKVEQ